MYGLGNDFTSFKGRDLNMEKPVRVFRNLGAKFKGEKVYSIVQGGRTVGHSRHILLNNVSFIVNEKGREFVRKNKKKIVHAVVQGMVCKQGGMGITADQDIELPAKITYNPYEDDFFMCKNLTVEPKEVRGARCVKIGKNGVSAAYIH